MKTEVVKTQRDIAVVTTEIKDICAHAQRRILIYAVEIGRRLVEAKSMLSHGEWSEWLKNEVRFSHSTANKHMQIFERFGRKIVGGSELELKSETFEKLTYSQALKLLAVPDNEVEEFVKDNNVSELSTRELDKLIKERDANNKKNTYGAECSAKELEESISELDKEVDNAKSKAKEIEEAIKKTKDKLSKAEEARRTAEAEADKAKLEIENLKKQVLMADPAVTEFKAQFNTAQDTMNKMITAFKGINDAAMQGRFKQAVSAMFDKYRGEFGLV